MEPARNVFGEPLESCSADPMTGFFRDGCCNTSREDVGRHTVCTRVTREFLEFSPPAATCSALETAGPRFRPDQVKATTASVYRLRSPLRGRVP